ncbi:hypothetical protein R3P38DRAFT_3544988 [Favolaschia claudopus]|uniref:Uncharacterized protein n=1 Tax=Favolaschia claudopus TaxID=2862362 RepID=A0AAW0DY33_9AGAR
MQCSQPSPAPSPPAPTRSTPRSSPASRARRRVVCILPPRAPPPPLAPTVRIIPTRSPDSRTSTLLPYYHTNPTPESPSIRSSPPPFPAPVVPSPELRLPPVDPRRSRRYCTDFGFGRNRRPAEPLPPLPPMYNNDNSSSPGSTPQATYAETDSDASSIYHQLDLEFPQPPVSVSPALRRMQSSPLFTAEETDAVRQFLRRRWGAQTTKPPQPTLTAEQSPLSDYSWDAQSPECGSDALELAGEQLVQAPPPVSAPAWLHRTPELPSSAARSRPPPSAFPPQQRVLRRATSMADPPTPLLLIETMPPGQSAHLSRSLRFQNESAGSSSPGAGQQKLNHRNNLSVPLMGLSLGTPDASRPTLGKAFVSGPGHRSARSQPNDLTASQKGSDPRSFIDLTPEKLMQRDSTTRVHRERVKRLLARASSGFIGWGKALAGKKAHH